MLNQHISTIRKDIERQNTILKIDSKQPYKETVYTLYLKYLYDAKKILDDIKNHKIYYTTKLLNDLITYYEEHVKGKHEYDIYKVSYIAIIHLIAFLKNYEKTVDLDSEHITNYTYEYFINIYNIYDKEQTINKNTVDEFIKYLNKSKYFTIENKKEMKDTKFYLNSHLYLSDIIVSGKYILGCRKNEYIILNYNNKTFRKLPNDESKKLKTLYKNAIKKYKKKTITSDNEKKKERNHKK